MEAYQQRVVDEKRELDERLEKLEAFLKSDQFRQLPVEDCSLLSNQRRVMSEYSNVLAERIKRFF